MTALLGRVRAGDAVASSELMEVLYAELHRIAQRHLGKERPGHTLQPTALVNEVYLRIFKGAQPQFADRAHFMAFASRSMRRILVDYARARGSAKRGKDNTRIPLDENLAHANETSTCLVDVLDLDRALGALTQEKQALAEVVEMQYFGGMTAEETAEAVGRSAHTVRNEIRFARAWLLREMSGGREGPSAI